MLLLGLPLLSQRLGQANFHQPLVDKSAVGG
jgi:hypothetical protein